MPIPPNPFFYFILRKSRNLRISRTILKLWFNVLLRTTYKSMLKKDDRKWQISQLYQDVNNGFSIIKHGDDTGTWKIDSELKIILFLYKKNVTIIYKTVIKKAKENIINIFCIIYLPKSLSRLSLLFLLLSLSDLSA